MLALPVGVSRLRSSTLSVVPISFSPMTGVLDVS